MEKKIIKVLYGKMINKKLTCVYSMYVLTYLYEYICEMQGMLCKNTRPDQNGKKVYRLRRTTTSTKKQHTHQKTLLIIQTYNMSWLSERMW